MVLWHAKTGWPYYLLKRLTWAKKEIKNKIKCAHPTFPLKSSLLSLFQFNTTQGSWASMCQPPVLVKQAFSWHWRRLAHKSPTRSNPHPTLQFDLVGMEVIRWHEQRTSDILWGTPCRCSSFSSAYIPQQLWSRWDSAGNIWKFMGEAWN